MSIKITGTGSYLPERVLTNKEISETVATSDEWVKKNLGIESRRIAAEDETTSDLAHKAAILALEAAKVSASELDAIIVATSSPDRISPSTACIVQDKLGAYGVCSFDINAVCSGFIYGLTLASTMLSQPQFKKILLIGAETYSRITNWNDRQCVYFGDGAGASRYSGRRLARADGAAGVYAPMNDRAKTALEGIWERQAAVEGRDEAGLDDHNNGYVSPADAAPASASPHPAAAAGRAGSTIFRAARKPA